MNQVPKTRPNRDRADLLQALSTLVVLSLIYVYSTTFVDTSVSNTPPPPSSIVLSSKYWNDRLGYGFESGGDDRYISSSSSSIDQVSIYEKTQSLGHDPSVRVSFYSGASIRDIEQKHTTNTPRTYSRLSNGIAVIE
jgi:hypothetical protein